MNESVISNGKTVNELRSLGFAVVVFNPTELGDAPPSNVEERLIEVGFDVISSLGGNTSAWGHLEMHETIDNLMELFQNDASVFDKSNGTIPPSEAWLDARTNAVDKFIEDHNMLAMEEILSNLQGLNSSALNVELTYTWGAAAAMTAWPTECAKMLEKDLDTIERKAEEGDQVAILLKPFAHAIAA